MCICLDNDARCVNSKGNQIGKYDRFQEKYESNQKEWIIKKNAIRVLMDIMKSARLFAYMFNRNEQITAVAPII